METSRAVDILALKVHLMEADILIQGDLIVCCTKDAESDTGRCWSDVDSQSSSNPRVEARKC